MANWGGSQHCTEQERTLTSEDCTAQHALSLSQPDQFEIGVFILGPLSTEFCKDNPYIYKNDLVAIIGYLFQYPNIC